VPQARAHALEIICSRLRTLQVKILRDPERLDAEGGPRSKGIGFVEFMDHSHALAAIRQLNNNPAPFGRERRPIVEFAIENAKVWGRLG